MGGRVATAGLEALEQFLARHAQVGEREDVWAGIRLVFRLCLADELPPREYVGSVRGVVFRGDEVLVVDYGHAKGLLVGGRPERGEELHDALRREVAEESGWHIEPGPVIGFFHARRVSPEPPGADWNRPDPDFLDPVFITEAVEEDPGLLEDGAPPVRFLPIPEAADVVHPLLRPYLARAVAVRGAGPSTRSGRTEGETGSVGAENEAGSGGAGCVVVEEWPTPYREVNEVLLGFLREALRILKTNFVGMYPYGSLASGDFSPDRSDIDFVVVTGREPSDEETAALVEMHDRFCGSDSPWANEIDGSYIPRAAMRRYDPAQARHLHVERGVGKLRTEQFRPDWVIQRHVIRESGVTLAGPPPELLIDPVSRGDIRHAVRSLSVDSWAPYVEEPAALAHWGGQVYAILTMCRMLHTLETGEVVSKQAAGRWALLEPAAPAAQSAKGRGQSDGDPEAGQGTGAGWLTPEWRELIERALAWRKTDPQDASAENAAATAALIRYTVERWRAEGSEA